MALDKIAKAGGYVSKTRVYIDKLRRNDCTLEVVECKLFASEHPDSKGDEMFACKLRVVEDRTGTMDTDAMGCVNISANLDAGKPAFQEKKCEEVCECVAVVTGTPLGDLLRDPRQLRDLLADSEQYAGKRVVVTSRSPKGGFYNLVWSTEEDYLAKMAKATPAPAASADDEPPKTAKRPGKGKRVADEADAL